MQVPPLTNEPCLLCQCEDTETRWQVHIPEIGERKVAGCPRCGFFFVTPRPSPDELERFYSREYFDAATTSCGFTDHQRKFHARLGEGWLVGRQLRREKPSGRVLDVGCATGEFLRGIQEGSGWEAFGTDLSSYAVEVAHRSPGLNITCGELADIAFPAEYFDAVFVRNVLEHVLEPEALIEELRRILRPGGLLRLVVPNGHTEIRPFDAANRRNELAEDVQAHLNFFTPACFVAWLRQCGFEVSKIYTLGLKRGLFELGLLPKAWKASQKGGPSRAPSRSRETSRWKQTLFYAYLRRTLKSSLHLPLWLPLGQELHVVLRRT